MILDDIKNQLEIVDPKVFYGAVDAEEIKKTVWDYTVFNRTRFRTTGNKTGYADGYDVHIVRENFIPEGIDLAIIERMTSIPGIKFADEEGRYDYIVKPNTNVVVEMLTLHFIRARK